MSEKLVASFEVAELLGMPVGLVRQAHNENSSSYRPMFPKPVKYENKKYQTGLHKTAFWREVDILDYQALCRRNPLAKLTRVRFEKAKRLKECEPLSITSLPSPSTLRRRKSYARKALLKALCYANAATLIEMLNEMDFGGSPTPNRGARQA